jgi:hypothetical protein
LLKLLPILLFIIGSGAGAGIGFFLHPETPPADAENSSGEKSGSDSSMADLEETRPADFVKLNNQFVVPIVTNKRVTSLIVMSLSIEVPENSRDIVFQYEPKLRDSFLQVLFDHANVGGFDGIFTQTRNLDSLRRALTEAGRRDIGASTVRDVLITEIARQDY